MTYDARKAAQVVAFFADKEQAKRIDVLKVVKLVYLADRESIKRSGFPILDEERVSMPKGPVNSTTLNYINGMGDAPEWDAIIRGREDYKVSLRDGAVLDFDELSPAELDCLNTVWLRFGHMGKYEIVEWTHDKRNIPEWEDPRGSSSPIPYERIARAVGLEDTASFAEEIEASRAIDNVFASLRH